MKRWLRLSSYGSVTLMWLLSNMGITWAQTEGTTNPNVPKQPQVTANTPVYLMPHDVYGAIVDGVKQSSTQQLAHYSHRSHSSHSSHRSHTSHYSSSTGSPSTSSPSYTPNPSYQPADVIDIRSIQQKLNDLGYDAGTVDGIKGQRTIDAIKKFQSDYGMGADGIVGTQTKQMLDSISLIDVQRKLKELGYNCDAYGSRDYKTTEAIKRFQLDYGLTDDGIVNQESKRRLDSITIMDVQKRLRQLGFICDINGVRDDKTVKSIIGFQAQNGLEANGIINKLTRDALGL